MTAPKMRWGSYIKGFTLLPRPLCRRGHSAAAATLPPRPLCRRGRCRLHGTWFKLDRVVIGVKLWDNAGRRNEQPGPHRTLWEGALAYEHPLDGVDARNTKHRAGFVMVLISI